LSTFGSGISSTRISLALYHLAAFIANTPFI
jgi:hypothetical protein